jgi:excisionase family DNA binding protein
MLERLAQETPRYVTPSTLAAALGVSLETIRRWRKRNRIPFKSYGPNTYRFDVAAVKAAIESNAERTDG